jgi:hypothetical protein
MLRKIAFSLTYSMDDNQTVQAGNLRLQCPVPYQLHGPVRLIRVLPSRFVLSFHESLGSGCLLSAAPPPPLLYELSQNKNRSVQEKGKNLTIPQRAAPKSRVPF